MALDGHHHEIKKQNHTENASNSSQHDLVHQAFGNHSKDTRHPTMVKHPAGQDRHTVAVQPHHNLPDLHHAAALHAVANKHLAAADHHDSKDNHHAEANKHQDTSNKHQNLEHHAPKSVTPPKESAAERHWEKQHEAFLKGALSCHGEWTKLIQKWVTKNEASTKTFEAYTPNDAGHGISVGLLQWNQKKGSLPELLNAWHKESPAKFEHLFGKYSGALLNTNFVQHADFVHVQTLNDGIKKALHDRQFQHVQVELRENHVVHSCGLAITHGFKSLGGRAQVADLANQLGNTGTILAIQKVPHNKPEHVRLEVLRQITDKRPGGEHRDAMLQEKVTSTWHKLGKSFYG